MPAARVLGCGRAQPGGLSCRSTSAWCGLCGLLPERQVHRLWATSRHDQPMSGPEGEWPWLGWPGTPRGVQGSVEGVRKLFDLSPFIPLPVAQLHSRNDLKQKRGTQIAKCVGRKRPALCLRGPPEEMNVFSSSGKGFSFLPFF